MQESLSERSALAAVSARALDAVGSNCPDAIARAGEMIARKYPQRWDPAVIERVLQKLAAQRFAITREFERSTLAQIFEQQRPESANGGAKKTKRRDYRR